MIGSEATARCFPEGSQIEGFVHPSRHGEEKAQ
jgi:hypothetical protein